MAKKEQETSDFVSQGKDKFPPIYFDTKQIQQLSRWDDSLLLSRLNTYMELIQNPDTMPRAKAGASRLVDHIIFELSYREGMYNQPEPIVPLDEPPLPFDDLPTQWRKQGE